MKLEDLTPEQKQALLDQLKQDEERKQAEVKSARETFKKMVEETVPEMMHDLMSLSHKISVVKREIFDKCQTLIEIKQEAYEVRTNQKSFQFSNAENTQRLTIGYKELDTWDGTEVEGVHLIKNYIDGLPSDGDYSKLKRMVLELLKPDKQGNLTPSKVLQLYKLRDEIDSNGFTEGVDIIRQAHSRALSGLYIMAEIRLQDENTWQNVPLNISSCTMQKTDGESVNLLGGQKNTEHVPA